MNYIVKERNITIHLSYNAFENYILLYHCCGGLGNLILIFLLYRIYIEFSYCISIVSYELSLYVGVGGIEAEAVMLGQAISMVLPEVVGYKLTGKVDQLVTSTDVVLTVTKVTPSCLLFRCLTVPIEISEKLRLGTTS